MQDHPHAERVHVKGVNRLPLIVGDDFRGNEAWSPTFSEDDVRLIVKVASP